MNQYDHCVFNKYAPDGKQITVCFHVDDLMITSASSKAREDLRKYLSSQFAEVSFVEGPTHSYLSMHLQKNKEGGWEVNMHSFIDKCLNGKQIHVGATSPATEDLFDIDESAPLLNTVDKALFHTDVARLLYLAKRTRLDILTTVSFLCSHVREPNVDDLRKLTRAHAYLMKTRDLDVRSKRSLISMQVSVCITTLRADRV